MNSIELSLCGKEKEWRMKGEREDVKMGKKLKQDP
jgi:hypothetical protein